MFAHDRQQKIIELVSRASPVSVPELKRTLGASPATIRRDLGFLERIGKIVRTHGGVLHPDQARGEVSFDRRTRHALNAKNAIAAAAAALAGSGDLVFVDAGTTALEVGRRLLARSGLTVFTNSVSLLGLRAAEGVRLVALGGDVRRVSLALTGSGALEWVRQLRIDVAFIGASGIDAAEGPSTTELTEAEVKRAIVAKARRVILVADASKWAAPAAIRFADWTEIDDMVTDYRPTRAERATISRHGTHMHTVAR